MSTRQAAEQSTEQITDQFTEQSTEQITDQFTEQSTARFTEQVTLREAADHGAAALILRPWTDADADALVRHHADALLRSWLVTHLDTVDEARRWVAAQSRGWAAGTRAAFAVVETGPAGPSAPLGHIALTTTAADAAPVRAGYWTAAEARGRRIASRALTLVSRWAASDGSPFAGRPLQLVHAVGNEGSCRTALGCGYPLTGTLPADPPARPRAQHLHTAPDHTAPDHTASRVTREA
ncbi:GNAT family N-acetyltransferase [Streptomyces sp. NPDC033753]|uniref:GNAT family N-acetyltransferase n=1 Tax=Streptomyces sp. NPDC033753 TaxID=3155128 RepID=UPI0033F23A8D